jgi:Uma2 family endonuclease
MITRSASQKRRSSKSNGKVSIPKWTLADLLHRLGDVAPERIRLDVWPGHVTDEDCTESKDRFGCLCEMVDGVLVEKIMAWEEARLASALAHVIQTYLEQHPLGIVLGPDGPIRIESRLIRMPDVSFIAWARVPGDEMPPGPVMEVIPDLAIEVISRSNRPGEMAIKLREYFQAGVRVVWYIYFKQRTARIYSNPDTFSEIDLQGSFDGQDVLPGFRLKLQTLYDQAFPKRPKKKRGK